MGLFDRFKKKRMPTKREAADSLDSFQKLLHMDINDIWATGDQNSFVLAMAGWLNRKCSYGERMSALTPEEKTVYIVDSFRAEINNGGFDQYLYNSSGALAGELLSSLSAIGADRTAGIFRPMLERLPCPIPQDHEERDRLLNEALTEDILEAFSLCERRFYESPDDLEALLYRYIFDNRRCFI